MDIEQVIKKMMRISNGSMGSMSKIYYILFHIIAISIIIYLGVDIFYGGMRMKYSQVETKASDAHKKSEEESTVKRNFNDYKTIIDRNIFSKVIAPTQKGDSSIEEMKNTTLKLVLIGTIAGDDKTSAAIIEDTGTNTQGLYRVGDDIQSAVIKSITRKQIVLKIGNREETLAMEESGSEGKATASDSGQTDTITKAALSAPEANEKEIALKRADIDKSLADANEQVSQLSIKQHSTDGVQDGLIITGIKAGTIFRKMGLRNGDIIKSVNNDAIKTTEDIMSMYNELKSAPDISLQILRRGQEKILNYSITD